MKLIAINTIGLTGAEILCAELARHPEIKMLPGQNFIRFKNSVYRLHDYRGMAAEEVFDMLSMHHHTRSGKIWSGLTKSMSAALRTSYSPEKHREIFTANFASENFPDLVLLFIRSYYASRNEDLTGTSHAGWFGNNIVINASAYSGLADRAAIINFSNPLDFWLGNINQRFVWNNLETIKFWIVNELFLRHYARQHQNYLSVDILDYAQDPRRVSKRLRQFLGLPPNEALPAQAPDGFIQFNPGLVEKIRRDAATLVPIYKDHALYMLAQSIDEWSELFLENPKHGLLLEKYRDFWNTSSHTNLDWVGPIEEEIVECALAQTQLKTKRNLNCWFYHECFELTCDHYETPRSKLEHYLGCLEDEILLPPLAYYARIVICYMESVVDNCLRRPYSAFPIRETSLYKRLTHPDYAKFFPLWALTEKMKALEEGIDAAEKLMSGYYRSNPGPKQKTP